MKKINTVTGAILPDQLGKVLVHEHISFSYPGYQGDSRWWKKQHYEDGIKAAVAMCKRVKKQGIQTIVDATTNDCGRDPELMRRVAEEAEINIICCSGYYFEGCGSPNYFKNMAGMGRNAKEEMYDLFATEVTKGIGDTSIKPGVLKVSSSFNEITEYEEQIIRTLGQVAARCGMPVLSHTQYGTMGIEQADMLMEAGVEPKNIMIGHSCDSMDIGYLLKLAAKGVGIGYDRWGHYDKWGRENAPTDKEKMATFLALIKMGHLHQLMCSHDYTMFWRGVPMGNIDPLLKDWIPTHFIDRIVPVLKEYGVTEQEIEIILADNPKRFFSLN